MRDRRAGWIGTGLTALATIGAALTSAPAQNPPGRGGMAARGDRAKAPNRAGVPARKAMPNAADPLALPAANPLAKTAALGTYHYKLRVTSFDGTPLSATYFPTRHDPADPKNAVVLLIHEKDRSSKDFEDPIFDLKGQGLAEHLQGQGYSVVEFDLRGHGANVRRPLTPQGWRLMIDDLRAIHQFLVDRNNRGELNLSKLGVVALGEGANLAAAWAASPGGAVSGADRLSDLAALVLISPLSDGEGFLLRDVLPPLATRIPMMLMVGERDLASGDPVRAVRHAVERVRLNRVEIFPSSLHGYKLLRLEPRVTSTIEKFLEGTIKYRAGSDWEPRFNLNPVAFSDIQQLRNLKAPATTKDAAPAKAKEAEAPK